MEPSDSGTSRCSPSAAVALKVVSRSVPDTHRLGQRLAVELRSGDVVELVGDLGAGKTHFVQGVAAGLGIPLEEAHSPTFMLIQEYSGRLPVCHIDAYRLHDIDEFLELGADELLGGDAVCLVEWGDRVADLLPCDRLRIMIEVTGESERTFHCEALGPRSQALLDNLRTTGSPG